MKFPFAFASGLVLTAALVLVLDRPMGSNPALGRLLDPFGGFWTNAGAVRPLQGSESMNLPGLQGEATVRYDSSGIPHVFAASRRDAALVQGYVVARDRFWQMEFQTHAAAGRLSEILGPDLDKPGDGKILRYDRLQRRTGMGYAAEQAMETIQQAPEMMALLEAYAQGVNAYRTAMDPADYPLEYKLLAYEPEPWTPYKTALLIKMMGQDLSSREFDVEYTNLRKRVGEAAFERLFPYQGGNRAPIVPPGTPFDFEAIALDTPAYELPGDDLPTQAWMPQRPPAGYGSNNWAVSGAHTASGFPLLANDPHLGLRLPSIWYQVQLHAPGYNVCGVSLPGAPGVIIGFNEDMAWGVTNAGRDVRDWYAIEFRDASRDAYRYEGSWRATTKRVETLRIKGGEVIYDTVVYTHHGPVVYDASFGHAERQGLALRWELHQPSNEMGLFTHLNEATDLDDYRAALPYLQCPGQNILFANHAGDIAITQQGRFPARWPQQGRFVLDGSQASHDWQAYIPVEQNAQSINPPRGFVGSANQYPADSTYPYYQLGEFEEYRNRRYVARLTEMIAESSASGEGLTPADMMALQLDNHSVMAADCLPALLAAVPEAAESLGSWNLAYEANSTQATRFQAWFDTLVVLLYDEFDGWQAAHKLPDAFATIALINEQPNSPWFDRRSTPAEEDFPALARLAWERSAGTEEPWWERRATAIRHLLNLPAFSRNEIPAGGSAGILNATTNEWGPSWRMVVELSSPPRAWGIYPGGQSGHPGDPAYDAFVDDWIAGRYRPLLFLSGPEDRPDRTPFVLSCQPETASSSRKTPTP